MRDLLPINATPAERALSEATARVGEIPTPLRTMWNPQTCPAALLPWLAWALSVDDWNSDWSEQQKRDTIAASYTVHSIKGTVDAVKASLAALGYQLTVVEWFEDPDNLEPYTFTVEINTDGSAILPTVFSDVLNLTDRAKNARSHLARMRVVTKNTAQVYTGATTLQGGIFEVFDPTLIETLEAINGWYNAMNYTVPGNMG